MNATAQTTSERPVDAPLQPWRVLFWEPVAGTGERLSVGVVYAFNHTPGAQRILRDDILDCLFGKGADATRKLIDAGIDLYSQLATTDPTLTSIDKPQLGLHPGELRATAAATLPDMLRTAALIYSSLANLDKIDLLDVDDAPLPEEVNRRFGTEVRSIVLNRNPSLQKFFNAPLALNPNGLPTKFGFASPRVAIHFSVLHPMRMGPSLRDARARILELSQARSFANLPRAALIGAVPRDDDPSLGNRQIQMAHLAISEIGANAQHADISYFPVPTALAGADCVAQLA